VARLMTFDRIGESRMSQSVRKQCLLAWVEVSPIFQEMTGVADFNALLGDVFVKARDGLADHVRLMEEKIGEIVFVRL